MKPRFIFVMDAEHYRLLFGDRELAQLRKVVELVEPSLNAAQLRAAGDRYADVQGIISGWGMPELSPDLLKSMPKLRAVFHAAGTIKSIATDASWDLGIRITSAASQNAKPTAEFAFAQIILSLKHAWARIFALREMQSYAQADPLMPGGYGSTVALLSLGKIGRLVARRLATLEVNVIAYDPTIAPADAAGLKVSLCSLEDAFARADVVSCHMPLTAQTTGVLGRAHFSAMKPGATFINTARGAIVVESELVQVLHERPDLFAILDVTDPEPPSPNSPLFKLKNVVLTPHIAGSNGPECRRLGIMMVEEVERYLAGKPLLGEVHQGQLELIA
ncbi:MAG TPA: hydroxyacid dehydrogenase [Lacunisphaera sp.]|nr:hydroxyacid dehydrogenase [Lacunisphaera sp.]